MAETIIDALIVELGLDTKKFTGSQQQAVKKLGDLEQAASKTEKSTKKIEKASKDASHSIDALSRTVASFLAIIGGTVALRNFVEDFIESNAALDRLSKNLGLSVSSISAWSNATEKLGGSAQALQGTLDMLSKSQTQLMITGESNLLPYMSALGISLADVNGKARPVTDVLLDLSDRFSHLDRTTANNLGRMMGLDQGTLNLLLQGRKELELEINRQKEQTAVTKEQAAQAQKFQTQIAGVKQQFQALGRSLFMEAAPYLQKLFDLFENFATWAREHQQFIADFLKVMAVGLAAIALATAPINLTVLAVLALGAAIALLWDDYQTWKKGGDSLIDWGKWQPGISAAIKGLKDLRDIIEGLFNSYTKLWQKVTGTKFSDDFAAGIDWIKDLLGIRTTPDSRPNGSKANMGGRNERASAAEMKKFFTDRGWSNTQAAGIAANLMSESGGNTRKFGDNNTAFGLAQWHPDRQAAFKKWAGHDIGSSTLQEQLRFVHFELTQGGEKSAGDALRGATTAADAGAIVSRRYERPKDVAGEASRRGDYASILAGIPGAASSVVNAPGAKSSGTTSIDKSIQTSIGQMTINTRATDADGIAKDMEHSLDYLFASQANTGLN